MYLNFMFPNQFLFEFPIYTHTNMHTHTDTHTDSDEYSIIAFCQNATTKTPQELKFNPKVI